VIQNWAFFYQILWISKIGTATEKNGGDTPSRRMARSRRVLDEASTKETRRPFIRHARRRHRSAVQRQGNTEGT